MSKLSWEARLSPYEHELQLAGAVAFDLCRGHYEAAIAAVGEKVGAGLDSSQLEARMNLLSGARGRPRISMNPTVRHARGDRVAIDVLLRSGRHFWGERAVLRLGFHRGSVVGFFLLSPIAARRNGGIYGADSS